MAAPGLEPAPARLLTAAAAAYRGEVADEWRGRADEASALAAALVRLSEESAGPPAMT